MKYQNKSGFFYNSDNSKLNLFSSSVTAEMESDLDQIETGQQQGSLDRDGFATSIKQT